MFHNLTRFQTLYRETASHYIVPIFTFTYYTALADSLVTPHNIIFYFNTLWSIIKENFLWMILVYALVEGCLSERLCTNQQSTDFLKKTHDKAPHHSVKKMIVIIQKFSVCDSVNEGEWTDFSICILYYCITCYFIVLITFW